MKKIPNKICSIDASTNSLAFAIFNVADKSLESFGKINFSGKTTYEKVSDACRKTVKIFEAYGAPDMVVIEHTVFMNSPKTAADLALVQGALLGGMSISGVKTIGSVSPITWQNFIGNKKLTKEEQLKIRSEYPGKSTSWYKTYERNFRKQRTIKIVNIQYDKDISDNDIADACAIGYWALHNMDKILTG